MTETLAVPTIKAARLSGVRGSTIHSEISKGNLKVRKVGQHTTLKLAFVFYFMSGLGLPNVTSISETVTINLHASVRRYESNDSNHQNEFGLDFKFGASTHNELSKKWRKKRDSNPR